jgi:hypothetical protein
MTGTNCDLFTHNQSRSYLNHLVFPCECQRSASLCVSYVCQWNWIYSSTVEPQKEKNSWIISVYHVTRYSFWYLLPSFLWMLGLWVFFIPYLSLRNLLLSSPDSLLSHDKMTSDSSHINKVPPSSTEREKRAQLWRKVRCVRETDQTCPKHWF